MRAVAATVSWYACNKRSSRSAAFALLSRHPASARFAMASTADHPRSVTRSRLTELVSFASTSHARAAVVLIALSLFAFIPGFFQIPVIDREEARFAQASKQMIESGDYLDIRFQDRKS